MDRGMDLGRAAVEHLVVTMCLRWIWVEERSMAPPHFPLRVRFILGLDLGRNSQESSVRLAEAKLSAVELNPVHVIIMM